MSDLPEIKPRWSTVMDAQRAVLDLGGRPMEETHRPETITDYNGTNAQGGQTCGCRMPARSVLPYRREDRKAGFVNFCMICDAGPMFPRVDAAVRYAKENTTDEEPADA